MSDPEQPERAVLAAALEEAEAQLRQLEVQRVETMARMGTLHAKVESLRAPREVALTQADGVPSAFDVKLEWIPVRAREALRRFFKASHPVVARATRGAVD